MRSPTLLTGVTGAVAVLVFVYVGLTAMSLQPHITFGDPNLRVASADKAAANPGPASAAALPAIPAAPSAPVPAPPATAAAQGPAGPPIAAGGLPVAAAAASPPAAAPVTPAAVPQMPPSPAATETPPPPMAAMPSAASGAPSSAAPASAPSVAALSVPAPAVTETSPTAADKPPAPATPATLPPAVAAAAPENLPASEASISERMAPPAPSLPTPTPPTPPTPRVASVPTPLARPTPTAAEDAEGPATVAEAKQADGNEEIEKPVVANTLPSDDKRAQVDRAAPSPLDNRAPPNESAALAPQPEKPAEDATAIVQPNGALKSVDLSRPFAERAGVLTIGGRSVQLAGIVPTDPERSCTGPNGKEWPCGTLARTALRSFLLGRTISCDVPDPAWKGTVTADCRFAKLSIGDWLVRNGWAEVASGSPFASVADEARKAGRGVYGNDPRKKHQSTLAPEPPKEDPLNPI